MSFGRGTEKMESLLLWTLVASTLLIGVTGQIPGSHGCKACLQIPQLIDVYDDQSPIVLRQGGSNHSSRRAGILLNGVTA